MWQTDFTYFKVIGWGWFYLCTVLDDFSRYGIAWRLCTGMTASDGSETLELAMIASGCQNVPLRQRPRLLSDNGPGFISDELAQWLSGQGIQHIRGAPAHPQTQGKIERWHQTMKNRILLENYYLPRALEAEITAFVEHYSKARMGTGQGSRFQNLGVLPHFRISAPTAPPVHFPTTPHCSMIKIISDQPVRV